MRYLASRFLRLAASVEALLLGALVPDIATASTLATASPQPSTTRLQAIPTMPAPRPGVVMSCQATSTDPTGSVSLTMRPSTMPHTVQFQAEAQGLNELARRFATPWRDEAFQRCQQFRGLWVSADGHMQRVEGQTAAEVIHRLKDLGAPTGTP